MKQTFTKKREITQLEIIAEKTNRILPTHEDIVELITKAKPSNSLPTIFEMLLSLSKAPSEEDLYRSLLVMIFEELSQVDAPSKALIIEAKLLESSSSDIEKKRLIAKERQATLLKQMASQACIFKNHISWSPTESSL